MANVKLSEVGAESRPPAHAIQVFADNTARNAHTYASADKGKIVAVGAGEFTYYIIADVVAGVATFTEIGAVEFGTTAGTAAEGDHDHDGLTTYGYVDIWSPSAPQTGLHADSDEFTGASIDASWTQFDNLGTSTFSAQPTRKCVEIACPTTADAIAGLWKPISAAEFQILIEAETECFGNNQDMSVGLAVGADLSNSASAFYSVRISGRGSSQGTSSSWTQFTGTGTAYAGQPFTFARLRVNVTAYVVDVSADGKHWTQSGSGTLAFTPADYGIIADALSTGESGIARIRKFAVLSGAGSSAAGALLPGRLVRVPLAG
jgi:hypothetical protein